jgi:tetratricopeptide (TPR) repeat protein
MLVWSESAEDGLDEARLRSLWPRASGVRKLGERLYAVSGLESRAGAPGPSKMAAMTSPDESPVAHAEAILAAARLSGARDREATALTDLGVIALNEGNAKGAIEFLEQALAITVESGDTAREGDVAGNLGMAMLAVRQPGRARNLFERTLAIARATSDRFAEKVALERLGIAAWAVRDYGGALGLFNQALSLARQLGDRQQQANLLWHQGIQHAELGQRDLAIARAEESVALFSALGKPQAASFGAYLQKYRMGLADDRTVAAGAEATVEGSPQAYMGGSIVASVMANAPSADIESARSTRGPGLLRMALSATKAAAGFAGSGFKTTPPDARKRRFEACAACEHHTGVRCQICGCFTGAKSRILHEDCPIGKWPA